HPWGGMFQRFQPQLLWQSSCQGTSDCVWTLQLLASNHSAVRKNIRQIAERDKVLGPSGKSRNLLQPLTEILFPTFRQCRNLEYISQSNDGKRLYRTLNHLRDGIRSHHGQQTALP